MVFNAITKSVLLNTGKSIAYAKRNLQQQPMV